MIISTKKFTLQIYNKEISDQYTRGEIYYQFRRPQLELVAFNKMYINEFFQYSTVFVKAPNNLENISRALFVYSFGLFSVRISLSL